MLIVALALVLLTAAVALLFAMMGELFARVPAQDEPSQPRPAPGLSMGTTTDDWPSSLTSVVTQPQSTLVVLSTACATCDMVAGDLGRRDLPVSVGVIISTGSKDLGEAFVLKHRLGNVPHFVDEGGEWVSKTFGVRMSPTALHLDKGVLAEAYIFTDFNTLLPHITSSQTLEEAHGNT
jgi:hypothetical protein